MGNKNTDTESDFLKKCLWKVDSEKISFMQSVLTRRTFVGRVMSAFEYAIQVGHNQYLYIITIDNTCIQLLKVLKSWKKHACKFL